MRQPKFRGLSKETNDWIYGFGWYETDYTDDYLEELGQSKQDAVLFTDSSPVICTIDSMGQCTGLKDKNGKEIYESDICHFGDFTEPPLVIKYVKEKSALCLVCVESEEQYLFNDFHYEELIVLGNKHEHEGVFY